MLITLCFKTVNHIVLPNSQQSLQPCFIKFRRIHVFSYRALITRRLHVNHTLLPNIHFNLLLLISDGSYLQLQGCYQESATLINHEMTMDSQTISPQSCVTACKEDDYEYAGVKMTVSYQSTIVYI